MSETAPEKRTASNHDVVQALIQTQDTVQSLITSTDALASQEYVDQLHREELDSQKRTRRITIVATVVVLLFLSGLGFLVVKVYNVAQDVTGIASSTAHITAVNKHLNQVNKRLNHKTQKAVHILVECTTPSTPKDTHECSDEGMANQAKAVGQLINASIAANFCADQEGSITYPALQDCVAEFLTSPKPTN